MKKFTFLSLLLSVCILLGSFPVPVSAAEEDTTQTEATEGITETAVSDGQGEAPVTDLAFGSVCVLNGCRTLDSMVPLAGSDRKTNTAQGVVIYERQTKTMIYSYNPDAKLSPGSLAKLVTALVVIERVDDLDTVITVPKGIAGRVPGGAHIFKLKSEERLTVKDLLYCMILQNAADAAGALAEYVAGTQQSFVELMNARVKQMGCASTEFGNVHGYDNVSQFTTARDMARFLMEAVKNDEFRELIACQSYTIPATNLEEERSFASTNYLMEPKIMPKYNYRAVTGGMASYSDAAGASVVCTANNSSDTKQGLDLVCVLLGATREFNTEPGKSWQALVYGNFDEMVDLLEYTYNHFKINRVIYNGQALEQYPVSGGESAVVGETREDIDSVLPADVHMNNLIRNRHIKDGGLSAPIQKGDMIGTIELWYRNSCLMEAELFAVNGVKPIDDPGFTIENGLTKRGGNESGLAKYIWIGCAVVLVPTVSYLVINALLRQRMRAQRRRRRQGRRRSY